MSETTEAMTISTDGADKLHVDMRQVPTVGRIVHYYTTAYDGAGNWPTKEGAPLAAIICAVAGPGDADQSVNLCAFDPFGVPLPLIAVKYSPGLPGGWGWPLPSPVATSTPETIPEYSDE